MTEFDPNTSLTPLLPWQIKVLNKFQGKGTLQMTGRQSGKSYALKAMQTLMDDLQERPIEQLVCSTGTIFGKQYFTVEPIGGNWLEMEAWSNDTFGPCATIWKTFKDEKQTLGRWYVNNRKFYFLDVKDRDWFIMRWSSE